MALCADEARLKQNLAPAKQVFIPRMAVGELDAGACKVNAPETRGPSQTPIPLRRSRKRKKRSKPDPHSSSPLTKEEEEVQARPLFLFAAHTAAEGPKLFRPIGWWRHRAGLTQTAQIVWFCTASRTARALRPKA